MQLMFSKCCWGRNIIFNELQNYIVIPDIIYWSYFQQDEQFNELINLLRKISIDIIVWTALNFKLFSAKSYNICGKGVNSFSKYNFSTTMVSYYMYMWFKKKQQQQQLYECLFVYLMNIVSRQSLITLCNL